MMTIPNTLRSLSLLFLALMLAAFAAPVSAAPTQIPTTTLSASMTASQPYTILASLTGVNGPSQPVSQGSLGTPSGASWTILFVDGEAMRVTTNPPSSATAPVLVERGWNGTAAVAHAKSALVWVGTPAQFVWEEGAPPVVAGACTYATLTYTPLINAHTGQISECLNGQWVTGSGAATAFHVINPPTGGTIYTSINSNGTTLSATTLYCTEVNLPGSKLLTGIGILNGTTVGTDNHYVVLYDAGGNALANSALAGAVSATASEYQNYAFTSQFYAVGPAQYFACMQSNGTTDTIRMAVTQVNDNILTKGQTGAVFGTVPALTVPTTFTTAVGPYVLLY